MITDLNFYCQFNLDNWGLDNRGSIVSWLLLKIHQFLLHLQSNQLHTGTINL